MNRDDAVWYYRLGGQTLGPVPWTEIEELTRDSVEASELLVARGGDETWRTAAETLDEHPELATAAPEEQAEPEVAGDFEMPPAEPQPTGPSEAASEVLGAAATTRDTGPPVMTPGGAFTPEHGIGPWLNQAWRMVIDDVWTWVLAMLLVMVISTVTLGIASPPMMVGLYIMALKRFRGESVSANDVFGGFRYFMPAWGLTLVMSAPALLVIAPAMILVAIPMMQQQTGASMEDLAVGMTIGMQLLMPVFWFAILAIQTIFFYSWVLVADGRGAWESVTGSWEKVKQNFWSYLGMWLLLSIIGSLGSYLCYVGMLVTYPLVPCAQVAAYMWHFRRA